MTDTNTAITNLARAAKEAAYILADTDTATKNKVLLLLAGILAKRSAAVLAANAADQAAARERRTSPELIERLALGEQNIKAMINGVCAVAALPDPVGATADFHYQPSGLLVGKMRVPLGVIGMIYESRPNVTVDAFALCFKAGNAVILRGGSEALKSNAILAACIHEALRAANLPAALLGFVDSTERDLVGEMLGAVGLIDVIIPRGGKSLVARVAKEAKIPVIKHLEGICHIYADAELNLSAALEIIVNAKTSRYGTCNTLETLLVHKDAARRLLPELARLLTAKNVEMRGCAASRLLVPAMLPASGEDWVTEYLAPVLAIKIVPDLEAAIRHINRYGSHHTDAIITDNYTSSRRFIRAVDSASVMVNASTRFADGFEYGLGAEIGISTDKLHARGPVGLLGLTSEKWVVLGSGQIRL